MITQQNSIIINLTLTGLLIVTAFLFLNHIAEKRTAELFQVSDCIHKTADYQGFKGTDIEKWELFAVDCQLSVYKGLDNYNADGTWTDNKGNVTGYARNEDSIITLVR